MSKFQHRRSSFQIVEDPQLPPEISLNSFQVQSEAENNFFQYEAKDDIFEISQDQNSFSFEIQLQKKQPRRPSNESSNSINKNDDLETFLQERNKLNEVQEQRKKKRKEVFEKYKQKTAECITGDGSQTTSDSNLLNAIDQIFKLNPNKVKGKQVEAVSSQMKTISSQMKMSAQMPLKQSTGFKTKPFALGLSSAEENISSFENVSSKKTQDIEAEPCIQSKNKAISKSHQNQNNFFLESEENLISMIKNQEEASRDADDIQLFLESELFKDIHFESQIPKEEATNEKYNYSEVTPSEIIPSPQNQMKFFDQREKNLPNSRPKNPAFKNLEQFEARQFRLKAQIQQKPQNFRQVISKSQASVYSQTLAIEEQIVKQQSRNQKQGRIPVYLRQIKKRNSVFPNFFMQSRRKEYSLAQNAAFKELLAEFRKGLAFLSSINEKVYERHMVFASLQKTLLNSLTLDTFMTCGWQKEFEILELPKIRPRQNFAKRKYEYAKVKGALQNYLYVLQYYQKIDLNLENPKDQKRYLEIRSKFCQIYKNIKMIGEDIYLLATKEAFPAHYYQFLKTFKNQWPSFKNPSKYLEYLRGLLSQFYFLRKEEDLLCTSQIGFHFKQRLQKMIHKALIV